MKIKATAIDKVNGKLVKYKRGDCLSIDCENGMYIAAFISGKFNKYYDLTLIEYYQNSKPTLEDFKNGRFWGTRLRSFEEVVCAVDKKMITCKYIDNHEAVTLVGSVILNEDVNKAGYSYVNTITELFDYYMKEIFVSIEKTGKNAEQLPGLHSASKHHLIGMKEIILRLPQGLAKSLQKIQLWIQQKQ